MSTPALALVPVLLVSTGIGANTGSAWSRGHRHHASRETTDGTKDSGEPERFGAQQWPGAPIFPFPSHPASRQLTARSRP